MRNIDVLWVSYDTPVDDDDNADVAFVLAQIEQVASLARTWRHWC